MTTIKYSNFAFAILLALCALLVSKSIWSVYLLLTPSQIMNHQTTSSTLKTSSTIRSTQPEIDIILSHNPYGAYQRPSNASKTNSTIVSDTRLDIKLIGILYGDQSVAIVSYKGQERALKEGEFIQKSASKIIQLSEIKDKYILISHNNVKEKIKLPPEDKNHIFRSS